jgi:hypothetical protein
MTSEEWNFVVFVFMKEISVEIRALNVPKYEPSWREAAYDGSTAKWGKPFVLKIEAEAETEWQK